MSKTFDTVQELWSYCLYCHICKESHREISVSSGPGDRLKLVHFEKTKNILSIQCIYNKNFVVDYSIDCLSNVFEIRSSKSDLLTKYCYFYIQSVCRKCNSTNAHGTDLELDLENNLIYNMGIEREGTYLLSVKDMYHVTMLYKNSTMLVSKCFKDKDGTIIDDNRVCTLPLVDLDFSDPHKAANRIKTMLVFS